MSRGKLYKEKVGLIDRESVYTPKEALSLAKKASYVKFDETVEVHFRLGIDPKHSDQQLRGTLVLPHGSGKSIKITICKCLT